MLGTRVPDAKHRGSKENYGDDNRKSGEEAVSQQAGLGLVMGVIALIVIVAVIVIATSGGGASYRAVITSVTPIDPAEVHVTFQVTNTNGKAGKPTCLINLSSPGGAYTGYDGISAVQTLRAGGQESYDDTITITHTGAQYVTVGASTVSCS